MNKQPATLPSLRRVLLVTAGNAVPIVGVYALGWSKTAAVVGYWFDGASALAAAILLILPRAVREEGPESPFGAHPVRRLLVGVCAGLMVLALLGSPFWFLAFFLWSAVIPAGGLSEALADPSFLAGLAVILAGNIGEAWQRGYWHLPQDKVREVFPEEFELLLCRVASMLLIAFFLPPGFVVATAMALTWVELYPQQALKFFRG